jgi:hypothetical protein
MPVAPAKCSQAATARSKGRRCDREHDVQTLPAKKAVWQKHEAGKNEKSGVDLQQCLWGSLLRCCGKRRR